ncbi:MAG: hypothetical protein F6J86_28450 [Symploca sp. SIO1B1]|nr:hypothetical protein [Symploca sp. SIO1C2]NER97732.1 hypothetical protein [Symploca sp. SIO1B1]
MTRALKLIFRELMLSGELWVCFMISFQSGVMARYNRVGTTAELDEVLTLLPYYTSWEKYLKLFIDSQLNQAHNSHKA